MLINSGNYVVDFIEIVFSIAMMINASLFIPQAIRLFKRKSAKDISLITFIGFNLIQISAMLHGYIVKDYLLLYGTLLCFITGGVVTLLIFYYRVLYKVGPHSGRKMTDTEEFAFFKEAVNVMPENIYCLDRNGVFLWCNDNMLKLSNLKSREDFTGKTYEDLLSAEMAKMVRNLNEEIMQSDQAKILEEKAVMEDGTKKVYLTHKVPFHNSEGKVIGLIGISFDITERKKAEADLKKEKEKAEKANAAKSQFVANMEHDLRTPTSGIYGLLKSWSEHEPKKAERQEFYKILSQSAWGLLKLLDSILEFTRLETGDKPIVEKKFRIQTLIDQLIQLEQPAAIGKHLKLTTKIEKNVPEIVKGDRFRVYRILINLVSNAVKFTQKGFVKITVKLAQKSKGNKIFLAFIIQDTGIGIPKEDQERIYEKFVKLDPSNRSGTFRGTGLGLTVVKQFVKDLGGEIDLVSALGKGSTFTIVLPFVLPILDDPKELGWEDEQDPYEKMIWFQQPS